MSKFTTALSAPLTPARLLMDRLAFAWKFALLAIVLVIPMIFIGWQYTQVQKVQIDFNSKELVGTKYIRPATKLVNAVGDARTAAVMTAGDLPGAAAMTATAKRELAASWLELDPVDRALNSQLSTTKLHDQLKAQTDELLTTKFDSPRAALDAWNKAGDASVALVLQAGNESNLILDPDLDTYYLMDSHVVRIPTASDLLGRTSDLYLVNSIEKANGTESTDKTSTFDRDIEYGRLLGSIDFNETTLTGNFDISRANTNDQSAWDAKIKQPLAAYVTTANSAATDIAKTLRADSDDPGANAAVVAKARQQLLTLQTGTTDRLYKLTDERVGRYVHARNIALIVLGLGMLLAAVLFGGLYMSMRRALGSIRQASEAIGRGELSDEVDVTSRDEIGHIAASFRVMTSSLRNKAGAASKIAEGDVHAEIEVLGPKDELGQAFQQMVAYLQETASVMQKLAVGDVSTDVKIHSERDALGTALDGTVTYLREMSDAAGVDFADLSQHITQQATTADKIADGDLSMTITPRTEHDVLGKAFQRMSENLREMISELTENAESVSAASEELSATSREVTNDMESATTQVAELEIGSSEQQRLLREVAARTKDASEANELVVARSQSGLSAMADASAAMDALGASTVEVTDTMRTLEQHGQKIEDIITSITSIADQTNLLALNAAIEAARAGEAGRGFAVVADEVRKLAEESTTAAQSVAAIVLAMQQETNRAVSLFEQTAGEATQSTGLVQSAREAFEQIDAAVMTASERVAAIATDAAEASRVAEAADATTQRVGSITGQTMASMEEVASSSEELASLAERLTATTSRFTTTQRVNHGPSVVVPVELSEAA